ncbi:DgyrCDS3482 [Dimorphilus gyrociliatus]|uniref:DgyrCDS3482 n=1 Tax=Dimorphilus gyrociliatus TaxID=2664684 RepID=A0A7I8VDW5_9ANNE|nr:DgyrCDS3482 [Dimorphilus gyrociliatus]
MPLPVRLGMRMPRVVTNQREKFESDEFFRKLNRVSEIKYTGFRDRNIDERRQKFREGCLQGYTEISYLQCGMNLALSLVSNSWSEDSSQRLVTEEFVDFRREPNKVHLKSQFILNGVCVIFIGSINLERLDGTGCIQFDTERAQIENQLLNQELSQYRRTTETFEERYRQEQERRTEEAEVVQALLDISHDFQIP